MTDAVTIVIPTRNRLELLQEAVAGIQAQEDCAWRLVIVDDHSTDATPEWLEQIDDPRIRAIRLPEHGERSVARNRGLENVDTEFVMFFDDDDVLRAGALATLVTPLVRHPSAVACVGAAELFNASGHRQRSVHPRRAVVRDISDEAMLGWVGPPSATVLRTRAVRDVGGWDAEFPPVEDQFLTLQLAQLGPFVFVPDIVVDMRREGAAGRRPADVWVVEDRLREVFASSLSGPAADRAYRGLQARRRFIEARRAWERNEGRPAISHATATIRRVPRNVVSPVVGARVRSLWLRSLVRLLIGRRLTALSQRLLWKVRQRAHRVPEGLPVMLPVDEQNDPPSRRAV